MKFIERVFWITVHNKVKMFLENNLLALRINYIFKKWDNFDKWFFIVWIFLNIFILNWLFSFIFVLIVDVILFKFVKKLWKASKNK